MAELLTQQGTVIALWGALALQWLLPIPRQLHPLSLWKQLARGLATKVNKGDNSPRQQALSGQLAWTLMWLTALVLLIAIEQLVWIDAFYQLLLLYLALDWRYTRKLSHEFIRSFSREDKDNCRLLLQPHLNRNTDTLSLLGLGKAGAETQLLAYGRQVAAVLFWFFLAGGIGALMYRLTVILAREWSPSRQRFQYFGQSAVRLLAIAEIIPLRLFALILSLGNNAGKAIKGLREQGENWLLPGPGWLLTAVGHKLSLSLGGPAIYEQRKLQRPKIGGQVAPAAYHLRVIEHQINLRLWLIVACYSLIAIAQGYY